MKPDRHQIDQFREQGYATFPGFFSAREIGAMRAELNRFKKEGMLRNVATDGDGHTHSQHQKNLQICPITPHSRLYRALHYHPGIVETVGHLIGNPFVFYLDQIFLKPGGIGIGTDWHQDNAYFKIADPAKGLGMWTALQDATVPNGTLHIIPGSHREKYAHDRDPNSDHHIHCPVPEDRAVPVELPAGGVVFFNFGIAHCTRANTTQTERAGLALHFLHTHHIPPESANRRTLAHITGPAASGGLKEYGEKVDGTWESEIDRALEVDGLHP